MACAKVNIANDERMAQFILGLFKGLVKNNKTELTIDYNEKGFEWSLIRGKSGNQEFILKPMYVKTPTAAITRYNLIVGDYEVEFNQNYNSRDIEGKFCDLVSYLQKKIRAEYFFDENSRQFFPRPKQLNVFQRLVQRLRGE